MRSGSLMQVGVQVGRRWMRWLSRSQSIKSDFNGPTPVFSHACSCKILVLEAVTCAGEVCDESRRAFQDSHPGRGGIFPFHCVRVLCFISRRLEGRVGKTSLLRQFVSKTFSEQEVQLETSRFRVHAVGSKASTQSAAYLDKILQLRGTQVHPSKAKSESVKPIASDKFQ